MEEDAVTAMTLEAIQWSTLPHIDDVPPITDMDHAVLQEIRSVLERHGSLDRFGVCLLHRHFDLADDEYLMEHTDDDKRTQMLVVEKKTAPTAQKIETMWRFSARTEVTQCEKACDYQGGHKRVHRRVGR